MSHTLILQLYSIPETVEQLIAVVVEVAVIVRGSLRASRDFTQTSPSCYFCAYFVSDTLWFWISLPYRAALQALWLLPLVYTTLNLNFIEHWRTFSCALAPVQHGRPFGYLKEKSGL